MPPNSRLLWMAKNPDWTYHLLGYRDARDYEEELEYMGLNEDEDEDEFGRLAVGEILRFKNVRKGLSLPSSTCPTSSVCTGRRLLATTNFALYTSGWRTCSFTLSQTTLLCHPNANALQLMPEMVGRMLLDLTPHLGIVHHGGVYRQPTRKPNAGLHHSLFRSSASIGY